MPDPIITVHPSVSPRQADLTVRLTSLGAADPDNRFAIVTAAANLLGSMAGLRGETDIDAALAGFREVARDAMLAHLPPEGRA